MQNNRNLIEDARNELEKAYGPLYSLLNSNIINELKIIDLLDEDKKFLDNIFATYPFMFPIKIYDAWQNKIQNVDSQGTKTKAVGITGNQRDFRIIRYYSIPLEFNNMINEEYDRRVKRYNELLIK